MQFTADTKEFVDTVAHAARAIPARPAHPILAGMRLTVQNGVVTCEGYDFEQSGSASMPVQADGDTKILLNGRLLADITKALGAGQLTITVEDGAAKAQLVSGRAKYSLPLMPLADYPNIPAGLPDVGSVAANDMAAAIRSVVIAAAKDDTLPILAATKVAFDPDAGTIRFTATDRYRLAVKTIPYRPVEGSNAQEMMILARMLDSSQKSLGTTGDIRLQAVEPDQGKVSLFGLAADGRDGTCRVLDGEYPAVDRLFPAQYDATATLNVAEFKDAITRVALVAERNTPVVIEFGPDGATLSAGSGDSDGDASEEIGCAYDGPEPVRFSFNPTFLQDGISAITTGQARIAMTGASKPVVISPVTDEGEVDESYRYLLMPVRLAA